MKDLPIHPEAIQIVAEHCFGRQQTDGTVYYPDGEDAARDVAAAALDDAAPLIVATAYRALAAVYERRADNVLLCDGQGQERRTAFLDAAARAWSEADDLNPDGRIR